jgi:nucleoside-diphosphate-sugar epimerase
MEKLINVFGDSGFIGSRYSELTSNIIINDRNDYMVKDEVTDIVYFISTVDNYNVYTDPYLDIDTNLTTLIKVLESCKGKDITFNFISSWFVYGNVELPAKETAHCDPKGFYSITKRAAEQLLISYCETFGLKYRILRLANVLGNTDKKVSKKRNALQYMINEIKKNNEIELYDGGNIYRDYIYVDDVVTAINLILEKGNSNEIYNIGNGFAVSLVSALEYVKKKINSTSNFKTIETKDFHKNVQTKNMVLNTSKLNSLGYKSSCNMICILDILTTNN